MGAATPKVSIVLPVYNGERFLAESIESCIGQSLRDWELIVVDDCSTDRSAEIIGDYAARDSRIRAVRNKTNQRLPNSLNIGFSRARGKYLTWTSDDNAYYPEALETLVAELDENPGIGFVFSNYMRFDESTQAYIPNMHSRRVGKRPQKRLPHTPVIGPCFLYRAAVAAQTHGYDNNWVLTEDYEYFLRLYFLTEFRYLDKVLYKYRFHNGSLTSCAGEDYGRYIVGKVQLCYLDAMRACRKISRRTLACTLYRIPGRMRDHREFCGRDAWFYFKEAFKTYPPIIFRPLERMFRDY